jgi:tyrosyl-tRNA synthetase
MPSIDELQNNNFIQEIIGFEYLKKLIEYKQNINPDFEINHYIGFEISGKPHLGTIFMTFLTIQELRKFGIKCILWFADWHSLLNGKLGGDLDKIRNMAEGEFKDVFLRGASIFGLKEGEDFEVILASKLYTQEYWLSVLDISRNLTLSRVQKSSTIMGKKEGDMQNFGQLMYPPMQAADIFLLNAHIAHAGIDQRSVHVIAREVAPSLTFGKLQLRARVRPQISAPDTLDVSGYYKDMASEVLLDENQEDNTLDTEKEFVLKPICFHHKLLPGLLPPPKWPMTEEEMEEHAVDLKMSKSKPGSAIFFTDTKEEIEQKMKNAFCAEGETGYNPVLQWAELICFNMGEKVLHIERPDKWGGNKTYTDFESLKNDFASKQLHPLDLKQAVSMSLVYILQL